jgi:hypothetical protein
MSHRMQAPCPRATCRARPSFYLARNSPVALSVPFDRSVYSRHVGSRLADFGRRRGRSRAPRVGRQGSEAVARRPPSGDTKSGGACALSTKVSHCMWWSLGLSARPGRPPRHRPRARFPGARVSSLGCLWRHGLATKSLVYPATSRHQLDEAPAAGDVGRVVAKQAPS